ncbi:hypothetical protein BUALT_Bualt14G0035200 [Buddleja alternifolia]|uniref:Rab-GAP TBC domain-containing protein n=1 Tax=Buddleja alternifolia TaxID=168488 RepID=A0AAV6WRP5_9LAMI|nr:hypothetical protein BUALT_Bualt14G0035200 [Buddleja alternifolia]
MAKKRVPDWLNSSLWSSSQSPPSPPPTPHDISMNSASAAIAEPPVPMPPVAVARPSEPLGSSSAYAGTAAKGEIRDPLSSHVNNTSVYHSDEENGRSSANSTTSAGGGSTAAALPAAEDISRQAQILQELSRKVINMGELRRLASQGIPDGPGIRATVWKLLLGYLPADRSLWPSELAKKRSQYKQFKEELLMNPVELAECLIKVALEIRLLLYLQNTDCTETFPLSRKLVHHTSPILRHFLNVSMASQSEIARRLEKSGPGNHEVDGGTQGFLSRSEISHEEHPLSLGKSSIWHQFFQDTEIMEQIDRDVLRTHPDIHFFSGDSSFAKSNQEALRNILVVFAKLNPGIRYVQGMNEILAPLFYVFKNDPNEENANGVLSPAMRSFSDVKHLQVFLNGVTAFLILKLLKPASAEADTFFCFVELLSGFRDNFVQQLDNSVVGIRATITRLSQLLKEHDEELWRHLEMTTKVNPQFYAFRWITLLLTQEFNFADSLVIWDTLLSDPEGPQNVNTRAETGCATRAAISQAASHTPPHADNVTIPSPIDIHPLTLPVQPHCQAQTISDANYPKKANSDHKLDAGAMYKTKLDDLGGQEPEKVKAKPEHEESLRETLLRVCCAMLIIVRRRLLAGDFTANLKLLQNYPSTNISHLLYVANKLRLHLGG